MHKLTLQNTELYTYIHQPLFPSDLFSVFKIKTYGRSYHATDNKAQITYEESN